MPHEFEELQQIQEARKAQLKEVGGIVYTNPPGITVEGQKVVVDEAAKELQVPSGREEITPLQEEPTLEAEDEVEEETSAPPQVANKGEWVAYRMETHGLTEDEANAKSKKELIDLA